MRPSSRAVRIKYVHVPKDGKTPIWNAAAEKWVMTEAPTAQQMTASEVKLKEVTNEASAAKVAAQNAQTAVSSKVSEAEALDAVRTGVFDVTSLGSHPPFRAIEFREESTGAFKVWIHFGDKDAPPTSASQGWLAYADNEEFKELCDRVLALEKKLGIK